MRSSTKSGISWVVSALAIVIVGLSAAVGIVSYQYASNSSSHSQAPTTTLPSTVTSTQIILSTTTVTTAVANNSAFYVKQQVPANFPKTCLTNYPAGFNINSSTYFIITNFTMNFAQLCVKYTYYPQNDTALTTNGRFDANFSGSTYITDSFGNASQGGPYPYDAVYAFPRHVLFNSTGDSVVVVYDFQWSFIFSYFFPSYVRCGSALFGIGIAQTNGDGSSGVNAECSAYTSSNLFVVQLVGTSYLKPAIG